MGFAKQGGSSGWSADALQGVHAVCLKYGMFQEAEAKTKSSHCRHISCHCFDCGISLLHSPMHS